MFHLACHVADCSASVCHCLTLLIDALIPSSFSLLAFNFPNAEKHVRFNVFGGIAACRHLHGRFSRAADQSTEARSDRNLFEPAHLLHDGLSTVHGRLGWAFPLCFFSLIFPFSFSLISPRSSPWFNDLGQRRAHSQSLRHDRLCHAGLQPAHSVDSRAVFLCVAADPLEQFNQVSLDHQVVARKRRGRFFT